MDKRKRERKKADEERNYSAYLDEYAARRKEKAAGGELPASSVHSMSLHGNSYHGRKVITPEMSAEAVMSNSSSSIKSQSRVSDGDWQDNPKSKRNVAPSSSANEQA